MERRNLEANHALACFRKRRIRVNRFTQLDVERPENHKRCFLDIVLHFDEDHVIPDLDASDAFPNVDVNFNYVDVCF